MGKCRREAIAIRERHAIHRTEALDERCRCLGNFEFTGLWVATVDVERFSDRIHPARFASDRIVDQRVATEAARAAAN